jgi:hypothetical protein
MFQVKRSELNQALDVLAMAPEKAGVIPSEYIRIIGKGNKITMSVASYVSSEVTVHGEGEWPFKEDFFLDRRTFVPWVSAARESKEKHRFQFHEHKERLIVKHGTRTAKFNNTHKISGYGSLSRIKKHAHHSLKVSSELLDMLKCGSNCAVSDTIQPHLNCVYTTGKGSRVISYAASDYVFYVGMGKMEGELSNPIPFPLFLINLLTVEGLKSIHCSDKYIFLHFKNGYVWQPISREAISNFPIHRIKTYAKQSKTIPTSFITSSRRFARMIVKMGYYMQSVRRRDWVVTIKGDRKDEFIRLNTSVPGSTFREKLAVSAKLPKEFKLEWPLETLVPVFEFISKRTRKMPCVVRINRRKGISYVQAGSYWMAIPSKQEKA